MKTKHEALMEASASVFAAARAFGGANTEDAIRENAINAAAEMMSYLLKSEQEYRKYILEQWRSNAAWMERELMVLAGEKMDA